ncbi:MAG: ankyrin repeat domain-containing protein [Aromatoleum sp.]|uniref:ankyrin repeat domain-containing protein n=1 Tax=Aromatoleum sp. TaxID=2307007 RepID=UPI002895C8BA|nr:ankyrin repeat domain-containing protein [Aromatoleum sp.]MDT3669064.1 ankyrin repeat domain-containing protein [Aromatoleum sp.]
MIRLIAALLAALAFSSAVLANSYEDSLSAARRGDTAQLVQLLNRGVDPNTVDDQGNTLLMLAAREGSGETVAAILKFRPKIAQRNATGDSALMLAALKGHADIVDQLLAAGAPVNNDGWTPLIYAAFEGHLDIVERLLARGAEVDALSPNKSNALMVAARNGHLDVVRRLLKTDVNIEQKNDAGFTAESWAMTNSNTDIAELIRAERARRGSKPKSLRIEVE